MSTLKIPTAKVFEPLLAPARYKGVYGGRGSGKSHFFGELLVETCQSERGTLAVCIREAQRTLAQSSKRLIESKIAALGLASGFKPFTDKIETPGDGLIIFRGMQDHTADSIKSLEGFRIAWADEAQILSARSLALLRPTIRADKSELWASWNPYNIPLAAGMDFWAPTAPNSSFVFPVGQAISRATYATLFAMVGTTFGSGDGLTTFNLPDKRGRVSAAIDNMGGSDAARLANGNCSLVAVRGTLGGGGGEGAHSLVASEIPSITSSGSNTLAVTGTVTGLVHSVSGSTAGSIDYAQPPGATNNLGGFSPSISGNASGTVNVSSNNTGSAAHNNAQPTIMCNYIMRII